jgi:recombinational DNA repair ATPase RecF
LYQGLTLVGPHKAEREMGLEMPQKNSVLYQGTTLVGPHKAERKMGFSPCGSTESSKSTRKHLLLL